MISATQDPGSWFSFAQQCCSPRSACAGTDDAYRRSQACVSVWGFVTVLQSSGQVLSAHLTVTSCRPSVHRRIHFMHAHAATRLETTHNLLTYLLTYLLRDLLGRIADSVILDGLSLRTNIENNASVIVDIDTDDAIA